MANDHELFIGDRLQITNDQLFFGHKAILDNDDIEKQGYPNFTTRKLGSNSKFIRQTSKYREWQSR